MTYNSPPQILHDVLPLASVAGSSMVTDPTGRGDWIYFLLSNLVWGRINIRDRSRTWQYLTVPPAGPPPLFFGAGTALGWDSSQGASGRIYAFGPDATTPGAWFHHFDVADAQLAWDVGGAPEVASLNGLVGAQWGTAGALAHPCMGVALPAADNLWFLVGNGALPAYAYDITEPAGVGWTTVPPAARPVVASNGCGLCWLWGVSVDNLYSPDGGGLDTESWYTIPGDAWAAYAPAGGFIVDLPGVGASHCSSVDGRRMYSKSDDTGYIYAYDPVQNLRTTVARIYGPEGVPSTEGQKMCAYRDDDGREHLLVQIHGTRNLQDILVA